MDDNHKFELKGCGLWFFVALWSGFFYLLGLVSSRWLW